MRFLEHRNYLRFHFTRLEFVSPPALVSLLSPVRSTLVPLLFLFYLHRIFLHTILRFIFSFILARCFWSCDAAVSSFCMHFLPFSPFR